MLLPTAESEDWKFVISGPEAGVDLSSSATGGRVSLLDAANSHFAAGDSRGVAVGTVDALKAALQAKITVETKRIDCGSVSHVAIHNKTVFAALNIFADKYKVATYDINTLEAGEEYLLNHEVIGLQSNVATLENGERVMLADGKQTEGEEVNVADNLFSGEIAGHPLVVRAKDDEYAAFLGSKGELAEIPDACPPFGNTDATFNWYTVSWHTAAGFVAVCACSQATQILLLVNDEKIEVLDDSANLPFTSNDEDVVVCGTAHVGTLWLALTQEGKIIAREVVAKDSKMVLPVEEASNTSLKTTTKETEEPKDSTENIAKTPNFVEPKKPAFGVFESNKSPFGSLELKKSPFSLNIGEKSVVGSVPKAFSDSSTADSGSIFGKSGNLFGKGSFGSFQQNAQIFSNTNENRSPFKPITRTDPKQSEDVPNEGDEDQEWEDDEDWEEQDDVEEEIKPVDKVTAATDAAAKVEEDARAKEAKEKSDAEAATVKAKEEAKAKSDAEAARTAAEAATEAKAAAEAKAKAEAEAKAAAEFKLREEAASNTTWDGQSLQDLINESMENPFDELYIATNRCFAAVDHALNQLEVPLATHSGVQIDEPDKWQVSDSEKLTAEITDMASQTSTLLIASRKALNSAEKNLLSTQNIMKGAERQQTLLKQIEKSESDEAYRLRQLPVGTLARKKELEQKQARIWQEVRTAKERALIACLGSRDVNYSRVLLAIETIDHRIDALDTKMSKLARQESDVAAEREVHPSLLEPLPKLPKPVYASVPF